MKTKTAPKSSKSSTRSSLAPMRSSTVPLEKSHVARPKVKSEPKPKTKPKTKPKSKSKRSYNVTTRQNESLKNRKLIIESLVELLVKRRGADVTLDEVAERSGISERTIFRFFKDKEALHQATEEYLSSYIQSSAGKIQELDVVGFAENAFQQFEFHKNLTMAYIFSPFGQQARAPFRKKMNQLVISKILAGRKTEKTPEMDARLAVIASLINAKIWYDIRTDFGIKGAESGKAIAWALRLLISHLEDAE